MYDADGDEAEWWQAGTLENYKKRAECFIDSYNSIDINNVTVHFHYFFRNNSLVVRTHSNV